MFPDAEVLSKVLYDHGFSCGSIEPIATGKHNSTYMVRLLDAPAAVDGDRAILRVAPSDDAGFVFYEQNMMSREPAIHAEVMHNTAIPVPQIYVYDDSRESMDRSFLIMEFMPGTPLSDVELPPEQRRLTMEALGRYLRQLHDRCTAETFGYPGGGSGKPRWTRWPEAFFSMWDRMIRDIENCGVYSPEEGKGAREALQSGVEAFEERRRASLLHMDIWAQNILVNPDGEITAILDWDRALWGDPEIEFAILNYVDFDTSSFWRGYGSRPPADEAAELRARFYHLYEVQKYLVIWTLRGGADRDRIRRYRDYSLSMLDRT